MSAESSGAFARLSNHSRHYWQGASWRAKETETANREELGEVEGDLRCDNAVNHVCRVGQPSQPRSAAPHPLPPQSGRSTRHTSPPAASPQANYRRTERNFIRDPAKFRKQKQSAVSFWLSLHAARRGSFAATAGPAPRRGKMRPVSNRFHSVAHPAPTKDPKYLARMQNKGKRFTRRREWGKHRDEVSGTARGCCRISYS